MKTGGGSEVDTDGYSVVKRHKRLHVVRGDGAVVYTPPHFVAAPSREHVRRLAERFDEEGYSVTAIMEFEAMWHPERRKRIPWSYPDRRNTERETGK